MPRPATESSTKLFIGPRFRRRLLVLSAAALALTPVVLALTPAAVALSLGRVQTG